MRIIEAIERWVENWQNQKSSTRWWGIAALTILAAILMFLNWIVETIWGS